MCFNNYLNIICCCVVNRTMLKEERLAALTELARLHPHIECTGYLWKNPFNPRSKGLRWTQRDLDFFRRMQLTFR